MRTATRITILTMCALLLASIGAASAQAQSRAQYWIEGRGWGHNIGMSQYGANGYAERGWTSDQIIRHYYAGTVVAPRPADGPTSLRVLLQSRLAPAKVQMLSSGTVRQGTASMALVANDVVELRSVGALLVVTRVRAGAENEVLTGSAADATIVPDVDGGVRALFASDHARFGTRFRGTLTAHRFQGRVSVFNTLPFESYLRGVVPDEMPPSWHPEALEAQAITARSYALRSLRTDFNWFDVYSDTRSQVYGGIDAEEASTNAAVDATAGLVARVGDANGEVAQTFFFSTSAGRTAPNEHVWGSTPYSYLRSARSPYEHASPYFYWRGAEVKRFTPSQLGSALGVSGFRRAANTIWPSGFAKNVVIVASGGTSTRSASSVQASMGLRSTFFRFSYLSVAAPNAVPVGGFARITGRAPTGGTTTLLLRRDGVTRPVRLKPTGPLGAWTVRTRMTSNLTATLSRAGMVGPRITIAADAA